MIGSLGLVFNALKRRVVCIPKNKICTIHGWFRSPVPRKDACDTLTSSISRVHVNRCYISGWSPTRKPPKNSRKGWVLQFSSMFGKAKRSFFFQSEKSTRRDKRTILLNLQLCTIYGYVGTTLPKFNMEPKKDGFQKESPIPGCHFQVLC